MPTTRKRGKKKTTTKKKPAKKPAKKPTKRPAKKGSKGGPKNGAGAGGGEQFFGPQEPIVISGGGSVSVKMKVKAGHFQDRGSGNWKHDTANLSSLSVDGGTPIPLSPTSVITIKLD
jgi:hypothetical protein